MTDDLLDINLKKWFGFDSFRSGQKEVIQSILNKKNSIAILPTGSGKSLIYQFCSYSLEGMTIVISPLLSLMDNQVMQMKRFGEKRVVALNSMSNFEEKKYIENHLSEYKFLFVSPEMLQSDWLIRKLQNINIALLVIDEAHCISQWGMDFRPDYLSIGIIRERLHHPITLALTATAPEKVMQDILESLELPFDQTDIHFYDPNRENLFYCVKEVSASEKNKELLDLLTKYALPGIIYFTSKIQAERVCQLIKERTDIKVDTYHADRSDEDRKTIQHQFLEGNLELICATSAFGMGINKLNVRFVIHYHLPGSLEEYLQEAGRAGRDGKESMVTLLYSLSDYQFKKQKVKETDLLHLNISQLKKDKQMQESLSDSDQAMLQFITRGNIDDSEARKLVKNRIQNKITQLEAMKKFAETTDCKRTFLSEHFKHQLMERPEWCCSSCEYNITELLERLERNNENNILSNNQSFEWKEKIINLFSL